jgi:hypothetical protein
MNKLLFQVHKLIQMISYKMCNKMHFSDFYLMVEFDTHLLAFDNNSIYLIQQIRLINDQ